MKISLVVPPMSVLPCPPFVLVHLAAALPVNGIEIKLFDLNKAQWAGHSFPWNEIEADIIGVSANFSLHHKNYIRFLKELRGRFPSSLIIVGGHHPTGMPSLFSSSNCTNHVVVGSGEMVMNCIKEISTKSQVLPRVLNVNWFAKGTIIPSVNFDSYVDYFEKLSMPQYDQLHLSYPSILYKGLPSRQVFFNRRCPFRCKHCVETLTSDMVVNNVSVEHLLADIAFKNKSSQAPHCYFLDPTFNADRGSILRLCEAINSRFTNLIWGCKAHVELFDMELIRIMANAGCRFVEIGLEAFDKIALDDIRKPHITDSFFSNLDLLTTNGISIQCNFMLGLPSDTPSVMESRVKHAHRMASSYNLLPCFWLFCPFPGSELWDQLQLSGEDVDWDSFSTAPVLRYWHIRGVSAIRRRWHEQT